MPERRIATSIEAEKIYLNEYDDFIEICVEDANFIDRFVSCFSQIQREYKELTKEVEKETSEDAGEGLSMESALKIAKINVRFSEKGIALIDDVFGEGTVRKYFRKLYESDENFLPGIQCFEDFFSSIEPVVEDLFDKSLEEYQKEKLNDAKVKMAKYKPQDYKKPGEK